MVDFFKRPKPVVLIIMDGVGVAPPGPGNAVTLANTPSLDKYWPKYPHTYLKASGLDVGLPHGVDGNSEVGHMNIGAGKIIYQDLPRIDMAIKDKTFFRNKVLLDGIKYLKENKVNIHIMGLVSTGQVHSSLSHLFSLIKLLSEQEVPGDKVFLHAFTDGRDSSPKGSIDVLQQVDVIMKSKSVGRLASFCGRYYGMDRDERWERTKKAYDMITDGKGIKTNSWRESIEKSYKSGITDEYIEPHVLYEDNQPVTTVKKGDLVLMFNFRPDRSIQITEAFENPQFEGFKRTMIDNLYFIGMTEYEKGYPTRKAFPPEHISDPMGKILSDHRLRQLRIAESEKFPHVTYFINCGNKQIYPGEDRVEVPSPKDVGTYDLKPEMSAAQITDVLLEKIDSNYYDFIIVNFANPDMVSHTGVLEAATKAMEITDTMVGRIVEKVLEKDGVAVITADHGNCEELIDNQSGGIDTKHSANPVPLLIIKKDEKPRELTVGILADIAPTLLGILGIQKPPQMTGRNLLA